MKLNRTNKKGHFFIVGTCSPWEAALPGQGDVRLDREGEQRQEEEEAQVVPCSPCPGDDPVVITHSHSPAHCLLSYSCGGEEEHKMHLYHAWPNLRSRKRTAEWPSGHQLQRRTLLLSNRVWSKRRASAGLKMWRFCTFLAVGNANAGRVSEWVHRGNSQKSFWLYIGLTKYPKRFNILTDKVDSSLGVSQPVCRVPVGDVPTYGVTSCRYCVPPSLPYCYSYHLVRIMQATQEGSQNTAEEISKICSCDSLLWKTKNKNASIP